MKNAEIAGPLDVIGSVFNFDPADPSLEPVLEFICGPDFSLQWSPLVDVEPRRTRMVSNIVRGDTQRPDDTPHASRQFDQSGTRAALHDAYTDLFIGPAALAAPPWGSVYLDEEGVVFGASTSALKDFLSRHAIALDGLQGGPEDHFGTLCWIGAWLAAQDRMDTFDDLLGEHVLPWAFGYLDELKKAAKTLAADNPAAEFYAATADLASATLHAIQARRSIPVAQKTLYRGRASSP